MRISGGTLRGRSVQCPPGVIRPAMDRMRESLFSIIESSYGGLPGISFLDLFSGSGIVGLEAYSRGAAPVVLVEKDGGKRRVILQNCAGLSPAPVLHIMPVERFVRQNRTPYSMVYLDPPFDYRHKVDLLVRLATSPTLPPADGTVIIHAPRNEELPETIEKLTRNDQRDYGGSRVTIYTTTVR